MDKYFLKRDVLNGTTYVTILVINGNFMVSNDVDSCAFINRSIYGDGGSVETPMFDHKHGRKDKQTNKKCREKLGGFC